MKKQRNKYADRGVSNKAIALRLPPRLREQAEALAKASGVSLNLHATNAYLVGIESINNSKVSAIVPVDASCSVAEPSNAAFFTSMVAS